MTQPRTDTERLNALETAAENGEALCIIHDEEGRWAVVTEYLYGESKVNDQRHFKAMMSVRAGQFHNSAREAIDAFIAARQSEGLEDGDPWGRDESEPRRDNKHARSVSTFVLARDFSPCPAGRYESDGPFSGEALRKRLASLLRECDLVEVILDAPLGAGSSVLEECFGGLVRDGFTGPWLHEHIWLCGEASVREQCWRYIDEEHGRQLALVPPEANID